MMVNLQDRLLELWGDQKEHFGFSLLEGQRSWHYQGEKEFNVASSYKVFILGDLLRKFELGMLSFTDKLPLTDEARIFDSSYTENIPNGTELSILELANAMMGYSDNTATELLQEYLGSEEILSFLRSLGLAKTRFPGKLKELNDLVIGMETLEPEMALSLFNGELGLVSTPDELAKFYQHLWEKSIIHKDETVKYMKEILSIEDNHQSVIWPEGVKCYRKSGNIELDHYYGFSLAGVIQKEESFIPFALCLNFESDEELHDMLALFKKSFRLIKEHILTSIG
ncbi:serine hydrolase [Pseudoneobacillus sp. C159]